MPTQFRRYEILLPTNFNDGSAVPQKLLGQSLRELRKQFGSISAETQSIEGQWEHRGKLHRDLNVRVFIDVALKTAASRRKNVIRIISALLLAIEQFLPFIF